MNAKWFLIALILSCSGAFLAIAAPLLSAYESYYLYIGEYPSSANPGWHEDVQGLTHDRDHWFITQTKDLWKIQVTHDLGSVSPGDPGVTRIRLGDISQLDSAGYNHFGDPEYYEFEGQGYLFIPIENSNDYSNPCSGVCVLKADTLEFLSYSCLQPGGEGHAPWVALDPLGYLYSSNCLGVSAINKYAVDWPALKSTGVLHLTIQPSVNLLNEQGNSFTLSECVQGGVISPDGELLYLVADGINVFDLSSRRRIQHSTNGSGYFNYEYHVGFPDYEEPEGITIWDLDDGRSPGIRGQLHVLLLDNDGLNADDIFLKHYTGTICVDRNYAGEERGTPSKPFNTVGEANSFAWDGAQIKIRAGSYPETLTFSKRIRVLTESGASAIIGQ